MMRRTMAGLLPVLVAGLLVTPVAQAQWMGGRGPGGSRGRPAMAPEDRERMYDHMVEHSLEHYTSDYELSEEQRELVRARLEELKEQHRAYAEPVRGEFEALREEMHDLFHKRHAGEEIDEQRISEIHDRMRSIWQDSPLMNPERAAESIEPLLPEEQVQQGRARQAQRRAEWEERRGSWGRQREEFRQGEQERGGDRDRRGLGGRDPWDRYVEDFARRYQLDESQQATAQSILRTTKEQRDAYRESHKEDFETLRQIEDGQERGDRYGQLNEPIERMFGELQERLDKIPTSAQATAAEQSPATSRPAGVTSRPAGATSRPAGPGFGDRRRDRGPRGR